MITIKNYWKLTLLAGIMGISGCLFSYYFNKITIILTIIAFIILIYLHSVEIDVSKKFVNAKGDAQ